jgi:hypothetical protein
MTFTEIPKTITGERKAAGIWRLVMATRSWWTRRKQPVAVSVKYTDVKVSSFQLDDGTTIPVVMFREEEDLGRAERTYWEPFDPDDWIGSTAS